MVKDQLSGSVTSAWTPSELPGSIVASGSFKAGQKRESRQRECVSGKAQKPIAIANWQQMHRAS